MGYTQDFDTTLVPDHSKFKSQPGYVRTLMEQLSERLDTLLYGFIAGETYTGLKLGHFISVGTGNPAAAIGTGAASAIDLFAKNVGTGGATQIELCTVDASGNVTQLTNKGTILLAGAQTISGVKTMTSHIIAPDTGPSTDLQYAPKGYVDAKVAAVAPLGVLVDRTSNYPTTVAEQATTSGWVSVVGSYIGTQHIEGISDSAASPTRVKGQAQGQGGAGGYEFSFGFFVYKNYYWKIVNSGATITSVSFEPIGS